MVSGRGLDVTGGTLDKLEAIPGFRVECTIEDIERFVADVGCCIVGQTNDLTPADRVLYRCRDVTATVPSKALATASIISKKAAENVSCLVLDVKYGGGAFMKTQTDAKELGLQMLNLGRSAGMKVSVVLSSMDAPIGRMVGNALEVAEAVDCLRGRKHPEDILELTTVLGGELLRMQGQAATREAGSRIIAASLADGSALRKLRQMLRAQGVAEHVAREICDADGDPWNVLPRAKFHVTLYTRLSGVVHEIDALALGQAARSLGAGRTKANQPIDHAVGLELLVHLGTTVSEGDPWLKVHHNFINSEEYFIRSLNDAIVIKSEDYNKLNRVSEILSFD